MWFIGVHPCGWTQLGHATVGMAGFEGRFDCTAPGTAINLAARHCDEADDGEILLGPRAGSAVGDDFQVETGGEISLKGVRDVDLDSTGKLYAADTHNNRVAIYDVDGERVAIIDGLSSPRALSVGQDGRVWVADGSKRRLVVLSPDLEIEENHRWKRGWVFRSARC